MFGALPILSMLGQGMTGNTGNGMFGGEGLFGGIGRLFSGDPSNAYMQVGNPMQDTYQVNPYTDQWWNQMQGQQGNVWNQLMGAMGQGNQFYPGMQDTIGGIDPLAAQNYFMNNAAGGYRDMAGQNFDQFNTANQQVADRLSNQAVQNISSQFANRGPGALRSGGAMQAISEGAINPLLQSNAQIGQMIGGQAGQLQGQGMGNLFNAYNTANQQRLGGMSALMGSADQRDLARQSLLGGLYGQGMGQLGQMAGPEWRDQMYLNNPNYLGLGNILSAGANIAGAFMGGA
jgi:hypothetical protein